MGTKNFSGMKCSWKRSAVAFSTSQETGISKGQKKNNTLATIKKISNFSEKRVCLISKTKQKDFGGHILEEAKKCIV